MPSSSISLAQVDGLKGNPAQKSHSTKASLRQAQVCVPAMGPPKAGPGGSGGNRNISLTHGHQSDLPLLKQGH